MKRTKVIGTIGPSIDDISKMEALVKEGVNIFRFNFSHGTHDEHLLKINWVKELQIRGYSVAVFVDLGGPKFRLGNIQGGNIHLKRGYEFILTTKDVPGNEKIVYAPLEEVLPFLKRGDVILLSDGTVELEVLEVKEKDVITKVRIGGEISSHKGINIPNRMQGVSAITPKDVEDMIFAAKNGVRIFALSFVGSPQDIEKAKDILGSEGIKGYFISKIERYEAVTNFDEILKVSDAIMVARGDLAVEIPFEKVPVLQKEMIYKARCAGKPVIIATQMLKSILYNPLPSRAEISDIANAVIDGADALMLSEETAVAKRPDYSVNVMRRVIEEAEQFTESKMAAFLRVELKEHKELEWQIARSCVSLSESMKAKVIITPTASGMTAFRVSSLRPRIPIVAPTPEERVYEFLNFAYGVYPLKVDYMNNLEEVIESVKEKIFEFGFAKRGDIAVITAGYPFGKPGTTNMVKVEKL